MTLEPVTSPKNLLNKLKIIKEALNSLSSHTRMFVCTKFELHLIQWLRLNFTSARLTRLQGTVSNSKQSYHQEYKLCKHPTLVQNWAYGKKYYQQHDGKDFHQSRVIGAVHESLHSCIDCASTSLFQRGVDARKICVIAKHKDERSLSHYISETTSAQKRECSKILSDTFQPQLAVQQEASGITKQNIAGRSAGPATTRSFSKKLQESQGKMSPARQPGLAQT